MKYKFRFPSSGSRTPSARALMLATQRAVVWDSDQDAYISTLIQNSKTIGDFKIKLSEVLYTTNMYLKSGAPNTAVSAIADGLARTFDSLKGVAANTKMWDTTDFNVDEFVADNLEILELHYGPITI